MKKLLLITASCLIINIANAQTLVDTNKVWNVVECNNFGGCATPGFHFGADTTIGIHQYKKFIIIPDSAGGPLWNTYPIAGREDTVTKKVFFTNGFTEYLMYDFSLNRGDTFTTSINSCPIQMVVDSVDGVVLLNGELRKRMFLVPWEIWIEGVGSLYGLPWVGVYNCTIDFYPELACFKENDTLKYHNVNYANCYYNSALGIQGLSSEIGFKVSPNPTTNKLTIESATAATSFELYDITGKLLMREAINTKRFELDLSHYNSGIYFLTITDKDKQVHRKIVRE